MAIGGGLLVLAIGAAVVFALVLGQARPAASPPPQTSVGPPSPAPSLQTAIGTASPSDTPTETALPTAAVTNEPTAEPTSSVTPQPTAEPTLPPTGRETIVFYGVRGGPADIFQVAPAGGPITDLTNDAPADSNPKWSPDGKLIVFDSRRLDGQRNIWTRDFENNIYRQLTRDAGVINEFATWSPDGTQIAWVRNDQIWVMNTDGTNQHAVVTGAEDSRPSWSPGGLIVFGRTIPKNHEIWTVSENGGTAKVLISKDGGGGRQPSWSPDGSRLAYTKLVNDVLRIWVVNANGRGGKSVTPGSPCPCQFLTWSPDGQRIAFQAGTTKKEQIWVVNASGGPIKRATDGKFQNLVPGWGT